MWELNHKESWAPEDWCFWNMVLEKTLESPFTARRSNHIHWKDWCWSWCSNILTILCEELTHWKRPWCWERLKAGGEGGDRGWDGWMASLTQWTRTWVSSGSWWWTGKPGVLKFMGSQRVRHKWATELNWIHAHCCKPVSFGVIGCTILDNNHREVFKNKNRMIITITGAKIS